MQDIESDPLISEFTRLVKITGEAEKQSDPDDWTSEMRSAYDEGNWREFSRLRGYTKNEIDEYARYQEVAQMLIDRYGIDEVASLDMVLRDGSGPEKHVPAAEQ